MNRQTRIRLALGLLVSAIGLNLALHLASFWLPDAGFEVRFIPLLCLVVVPIALTWAVGNYRTSLGALVPHHVAEGFDTPQPGWLRPAQLLGYLLFGYAILLILLNWNLPDQASAQHLANLRVTTAIGLALCYLLALYLIAALDRMNG